LGAFFIRKKNKWRIKIMKLSELWKSMKERMGITNPDMSPAEVFERDKKIVPDCVTASENEIPVKQYNIAILRRLFSFTRAEGRMQVTNKRVIFRASGRNLGRKTTWQQEHAIDDLAGIEAERNNRFNPLYCMIGLMVAAVGFMLVNLTIVYLPAEWAFYLVGILIGLGGLVPFFLLSKLFLLKLLPLGISMGAFYTLASFGSFAFFIGVAVVAALLVWGLRLYCIRPTFNIVLKPNGAMGQPIKIGHTSKLGALMGLMELIPNEDSENAIKEIGAIIKDIQTLGDLGVEKWTK
jgi:hypothetical protein